MAFVGPNHDDAHGPGAEHSAGYGRPLWSDVTARVSRIRRGCDGDRFYTRITFPHLKAAPEMLSDSCEPSG
jgi:hypothetical protein